MGTEILRPQDCLIGRFRPIPTFLPRWNPNPSPNPNPIPNPKQIRKSPAKNRREGSPKPAKNGNTGDHLVMGQVTILKRGESLDSKKKKKKQVGEMVYSLDGGDLMVFGTGRLGPDPDLVPKQIRLAMTVGSDVYAGSGFAVSPSPNSLPLPSFSKKKDGSAIVDFSATQDLRRLLRLD